MVKLTNDEIRERAAMIFANLMERNLTFSVRSVYDANRPYIEFASRANANEVMLLYPKLFTISTDVNPDKRISVARFEFN